ncbi:ExbD/TolR family protein [Oleiharenicola lentus]|uniref:ExbD/TolR family protein n=1 Tax=Oleiharenicola lentus TaxID=2508720 RepID=UPI003F665721
MEGNKIKVRPLKKARIEIIPLIDVIFFLLATFVLFTLSLNSIKSVPIDLPVPAPPTTVKPEEPLTIQVSDAGSIYWNRELIDPSELPSRLSYYRSQNADPRVLLTGDEKARFGATIDVLDEVRKAGILKFSVETRTRPTGK